MERETVRQDPPICGCRDEGALAMLVTTDGIHDSRAFRELLRKAERHGKVCRVFADGAHDSLKVYRTLEQKEIEAVIKPRRNS